MVIHKVKAHPERDMEVKDWGDREVGIWIADSVARGELDPNGGEIDAEVMMKGLRPAGTLYLSRRDGGWMDGKVDEVLAERRMENYLVTRDEYRVKRGRRPKWGGSYGGLGLRLMRRRKGIEETAVIQRVMYDKRWSWKKGDWGVEGVCCDWCSLANVGRGHMLFECGAAEVVAKRGEWEEGVWKHVGKMNKDWRKEIVEDVAGDVFRGHNDMLACGVVEKNWGIGRRWSGKLIDKGKMRVVENGLKVIFGGARDLLLMRKKGPIEAPLRQTRITEFFRIDKKRKGREGETLPGIRAIPGGGGGNDGPRRREEKGTEGKGVSGGNEKKGKGESSEERVKRAMGRLVPRQGDGGIYWEFKAG